MCLLQLAAAFHAPDLLDGFATNPVHRLVQVHGDADVIGDDAQAVAHGEVMTGTADITAVYQGLTDSVSTLVRDGLPPYPYMDLSLFGPQPSVGMTATARAYFYQSAVVGSQNVTGRRLTRRP